MRNRDQGPIECLVIFPYQFARQMQMFGCQSDPFNSDRVSSIRNLDTLEGSRELPFAFCCLNCSWISCVRPYPSSPFPQASRLDPQHLKNNEQPTGGTGVEHTGANPCQ